MTNPNINKIKKRLFKDLETNIIENPENPDEVIFERVIHKFERNNIYIEYNLKENEINQIYQYHKKRKKILHNGKPNISDSRELNKYILRK
ncbi:MAG: hypothetical protein Q8O84_05160 [Nanoarchaeota archaeon]|nr:hypothetical protein [Nanoarchaeota archaeon]